MRPSSTFSHFVDLLGDRHAFLDVLELHRAGVFGNDRAGQRIPGRQRGAGLDRHAVLHDQGRAVRHLVALALAAVVVGDQHFARTGNDDLLALAVGDVAHRDSEAHRAV